MAVTYAATQKNDRLNIVRDRLKNLTPAASTGTATDPVLVIGTSALSGATGVLATITLPNAGVTVTTNVLTLMASAQSATASATGTAALAELRSSVGTVIVSGLTVGTSGTDVIINNTSITSGQTVQVTAGTITHP